MKHRINLCLLNILCMACCVIVSKESVARSQQMIHTKEVEVWFDATLDTGARDLAHIFPEIKRELESTFGWKFYKSPKVFLFKKREDFLHWADNPITIAFAAPEKNMIVIDYSKVSMDPFRLENTLKHELCHILLHQHINANLLPRWLDEGLCQWTSNSINEILYTQKQSALNGVTLSLRTVSLSDLRQAFPGEIKSRILAYEASKRFTIYLIDRYGKAKIIDILKRMARGQDIETSILLGLSEPLNSIKKKWHDTLKQKETWFTFLSYYLYEILFAIMALLTFYGFIKLRTRKIRYRDEEEKQDHAAGNGML